MAYGKVLTTNRKAYHEYHIEEAFEAGIALTGTEVKSLREGRANLRDGYAAVEGGEVFLANCHISPYTPANRFNHVPLRRRKLLLHRAEIRRLIGKVQEKGLTLIPLSLYLKNGRVKVELALCRGKKQYDKREDLKRRTQEREVAEA
ncbi:MAG: SsrA-binding protein SmpB, partial [Candidatus Methylomirabilales bacterium]